MEFQPVGNEFVWFCKKKSQELFFHILFVYQLTFDEVCE